MPLAAATMAAVPDAPSARTRVRRHAGRELGGVVFFSGTVPTVDGELIYGDAYELELADPRLGRKLRTHYTVQVLEGR